MLLTFRNAGSRVGLPLAPTAGMSRNFVPASSAPRRPVLSGAVPSIGTITSG